MFNLETTRKIHDSLNEKYPGKSEVVIKKENGQYIAGLTHENPSIEMHNDFVSEVLQEFAAEDVLAIPMGTTEDLQTGEYFRSQHD